MSNEQISNPEHPTAPDEPWQGAWPGPGPAPTNDERKIVEGKWSESRQRADWTGEHHENATRDARTQQQASADAESDMADQVREGTDEPV